MTVFSAPLIFTSPFRFADACHATALSARAAVDPESRHQPVDLPL